MKKAKPKKVKKAKPKKVKKAKPKKPHIVTKGIKTAFRPSKKQLAILTAMEKQKKVEEDDWRLKAVHHNINQSKKAIYDLSINVEGEHDHIFKIVQRCHDRIEHVEGLVIQLAERIDNMVFVINKCGERLNEFGKYDKPVMSKEDTEERIRAALDNLGDDNGR